MLGRREDQGLAKQLEAAERDLQKKNQLLKALIKNQKKAGEVRVVTCYYIKKNLRLGKLARYRPLGTNAPAGRRNV